MRKCLLATPFLVAALACVRADQEEGIVTDITTDTIKIQQGGAKLLTFALSSDLMSNTVPPEGPRAAPGGPAAKVTEIRKGDKVELEYHIEDGRNVCTGLSLRRPGAVGVVTAVGPDTITIRNDEGTTHTYKVDKEFVQGHRENNEPLRHWDLYPSRFSDVTPGCRIEAFTLKRSGEPTIIAVDVKKETGKDPEKP